MIKSVVNINIQNQHHINDSIAIISLELGAMELNLTGMPIYFYASTLYEIQMTTHYTALSGVRPCMAVPHTKLQIGSPSHL